jgi:hypothetical protein
MDWQQLSKKIKRNYDFIDQGTTRPEAVSARIEPCLQVVDDIVNESDKAIKNAESIQRKLDEISICNLCSNPVNADDAAWITVGTKQELTHRFCGDNSK